MKLWKGERVEGWKVNIRMVEGERVKGGRMKGWKVEKVNGWKGEGRKDGSLEEWKGKREKG